MEIKPAKFIPALLMLSLWMVIGCSDKKNADVIITGGKIYTLNPHQPSAEAVAVQGDRIVFVGSFSDARKLQGSNTDILDLKGNTALPGLIDAHAHLSSLGRFQAELNLTGTASAEEVRRMVLEKQKIAPEGSWISGRGWDQNDWQSRQFPTWRDLVGTEDHPVYLRRVDGHAAWINRTALDLCGITKDTPDPPGGRILRDAEGQPTGIFLDNAADLIRGRMPLPSNAERINWLKTAMKECNRFGLVGVHDAGIDTPILDAYRDLLSREELTLRVYAMLDGEDSVLVKRQFAEGFIEDASHFFTVRAVKLYSDGALGSRGAALLEPYNDEPSSRGLLVNDSDHLSRSAKQALEYGFQVCTHAIGDDAVRMTLDAYAKALADPGGSLSAHPGEDRRCRIEHAEVISPQDLPRFAQLAVIPSMQPTHATSDMVWLEDRLGAERLPNVCPWRRLLDQGNHIPCGSDFPVESPNPLWGIYAAVTRQDHQGRPEGGWYPEERMTIEEAVRGFTLDAAYAEFAEDLKGSIGVGKLADFTVLDQDMFSIPPQGILDTRVVYTIVGGKIVYSVVSE